MSNSSLAFQLQMKESQYTAIQNDYLTLKDKHISLEKEYSDLKISNNYILRNEKNSKIYLETIDNLEKEVARLKEEIKVKERQHSDALKTYDYKYNKDIDYYKNIHDTINVKLESVPALDRLCEGQQKRIIDLEADLKSLQTKTNDLVRKNKITSDLKLTDLKKKMMDHIKETQKNVSEFNMKNMDVSTKLTMLQNSQLLIELEYQSLQIEDLLKKKEKHEKQILELKKDLDIQRDVQNILAEKNKKFVEVIKNLSSSLQASQSTSPTNIAGINLNSFNVPFNNKIRDFNYSSNPDKKKHDLEKQLSKKEIDFNTLKHKYESVNDKLKVFEKKMKAVYNLFDAGLNSLSQDEELKKMKEIYVNIEAIKNDDFGSLNNTQKYTVLMLLIKHILPLVNLFELENTEFMKKNVSNVKVKYQLKEKGAEKGKGYMEGNKNEDNLKEHNRTNLYSANNRTYSLLNKNQMTVPNSASTNYNQKTKSENSYNHDNLFFKRSLHLDGMNTTTNFRNTFSNGFRSEKIKKKSNSSIRYKIID